MACKQKFCLQPVHFLILSFFVIVAIRTIIPNTTLISFRSTEHHQNVTYNFPTLDTSDEYKWFYPTLTVCIGVQKGGTTSVQEKLRNIHYINSIKGIHYFDEEINATANLSITTVTTYIERILQQSSSSDNEQRHTHYHFIKTPSYCIYPHVARLMASGMVTHGTKILLFLRHPRKRFISAYFQSHGEINKINEMLDMIFNDNNTAHGNNSLTSFNSYLHMLYDQYVISRDDRNHFVQIMDRYSEMIYYYTNKKKIKHDTSHKALIWLRSCYAPQVLTWLHYIESVERNEEYKHQFKIVQSELLFDKNTFGDTFRLIVCFVKYNMNEYEYDDFMTECVKNQPKETMLEKVNSKAQPVNITQTVAHVEELSFQTCNKWLKVVLDERPHLLFDTSWDWNKWDHIPW